MRAIAELLRNASRGAWLRKQREDAGLGLREFARKTGVGPGYLSMLETGSLEAPSSEMLDMIAKGLDVDSGTLHLIFGYLPPSVIEKLDKYPDRAGEVLSVLEDLNW